MIGCLPEVGIFNENGMDSFERDKSGLEYSAWNNRYNFKKKEKKAQYIYNKNKSPPIFCALYHFSMQCIKTKSV